LTATVTLPKIETLTDYFNGTTVDATKWDSSRTTESGGFLVQPHDDVYGQADSHYHYDFTGSFISVKVTPGQTSPGTDIGFVVGFNVDQDAAIIGIADLENGHGFSIFSQRRVAGVYITHSSYIPYDATLHRWLRIRESSGTIYFDYSADGLSWTNFDTVAVWTTITDSHVGLTTGDFDTFPAASSAHWDYFNLPPATAAITGAGSLSATDVKNGKGAGVVTTSGSLAATGRKNARPAVTLAGTGSLAATDKKAGLGASSLSGTGSLSETQSIARAGTATCSGAGSLSEAQEGDHRGPSTCSGTGDCSGAGAGAEAGQALITSAGSLSTSASGDHTEAVDTTVTGFVGAQGSTDRESAATLSGSVSLGENATGDHAGSASISGASSATASGIAAESHSGSGTCSGSALLAVLGRRNASTSGSISAGVSGSAAVVRSAAYAVVVTGSATLLAVVAGDRSGDPNMSVLALAAVSVVKGSDGVAILDAVADLFGTGSPFSPGVPVRGPTRASGDAHDLVGAGASRNDADGRGSNSVDSTATRNRAGAGSHNLVEVD
ncbi:MAG: hypothetical protein M3P43_13240, partial [Actinomycetota bacterium]|nr:hypothetical protein [Actinomycetota bacterium]